MWPRAIRVHICSLFSGQPEKGFRVQPKLIQKVAILSRISRVARSEWRPKKNAEMIADWSQLIQT